MARQALILAITLAVGVAAGTLTRAHAQGDERDVFVSVVDDEGTPITGMTAEHFAIREDGRDREVLRVAPLITPMHVAVLVDTSLGTAVPIETYRAAVISFVQRLASLNHVALYTFGERARLVVPFTQDGEHLKNALLTAFPTAASGSYLVDAVDLATRDLAQAEAPRPAIIAVTTESPEASGRSAGSVVKQMIPRAIVFHAVALASATGSATRANTRISRDIPTRRQEMDNLMVLGEGDRERTQVLQQGTRSTGGSLQRVTGLLALEPALTRLYAQCAQAYRVTFARPNANRPLKDLQVGVMLEGVTVRATAAPGAPR